MIHFTMSETELQSLSARETAGDYAAWNYFQSLDLPENQAFVKHVRYGWPYPSTGQSNHRASRHTAVPSTAMP
jgi:hypothetical protein